MQAAREKNISLNSYINCQQLYVDEVLGGRLHRHYDALLEGVIGSPATRRAMLRLLYETATSESERLPVETWRKRLGIDDESLQNILSELHVQELANVNGNFVEVSQTSSVWKDFLKKNYRLEISADPRALVVADMILETLKRAPQTMSHHYRQQAAVGLRELMERFNCQQVPASLLHFDRFKQAYKTKNDEELVADLESEADLVRLPQLVYTANAMALHPAMKFSGNEELCFVGHGFEAGNYIESNQVVWLAAEIGSKLEAGRGLTEMWCDRLQSLARALSFNKVRLWLISNEGFSSEACELLNEREAYNSSRRQLELLNARLDVSFAPAVDGANKPDDFELIIPMGEDTELIAAHTVEQIARRLNFPPEAINQIKTALIEACINASEHSLSPDRKIYQCFRVENDKLIITVASRGLTLSMIEESKALLPTQINGSTPQDIGKGRRGWGLKLIRTLMDEVEFEHVDDGTSLRMTKFLRK